MSCLEIQKTISLSNDMLKNTQKLLPAFYCSLSIEIHLKVYPIFPVMLETLPGRDCLPVSQDGREGRFFFPVFSGLFSQGTDSTDDGTLIIQVYCVTHVFLYSWLSSSFS